MFEYILENIYEYLNIKPLEIELEKKNNIINNDKYNEVYEKLSIILKYDIIFYISLIITVLHSMIILYNVIKINKILKNIYEKSKKNLSDKITDNFNMCNYDINNSPSINKLMELIINFEKQKWEFEYKNQQMTIKQINEQVSDNAEEQVSDNTEEQVSDNTEEQVSDNTEEQVSDNTEEQVSDNAEEQVSDNAEEQVSDNAEEQVSDNTEEQVSDNTEEQINEQGIIQYKYEIFDSFVNPESDYNDAKLEIITTPTKKKKTKKELDVKPTIEKKGKK
jgi:hypothetical protein